MAAWWAQVITEENVKDFDRERMLAALVARLRRGRCEPE